MIGVLNINDQNLDIDERVIVPLNYAIADAREPQKRKRNTSNVIALKGTKKNKDFFFSAWNLGASDERADGIGFNFDPTIKYKAYYTEKGEVIFNGTATLDSIDVVGENLTFNVILYSNVVDVFQTLGDLTLNELDWSALDHTLSVANIIASWSTAIGSGYVYPLVDYGFTNDLLTYKTNEIFPHVYWKQVFEKSFALSNLTIDSDFFDSTLFKSLVIGTGGGSKQLLSPAEIAQRRSDHTADGTITKVITSPVVFPVTPALPIGASTYYHALYQYGETVRIQDSNVITTALVNDPLTQFDVATGRLTASNTGQYNLNVTGTFPFTFGFTGGTPTATSLISKLTLNVRRNGAIINNNFVDIDETFTSPHNFVINFDQSLFLEASDVLEFEVVIYISGATADAASVANLPTSFDYSLDLNNTFEFNLTSTQAEVIDGNTINVASYLPDIKVSDFLNGVIKAFNLYVGEPNERGEVKIEPLTDFYQSTADAKQMSEKVDYSKKINIQPAAGIEGKRYIFKFAEDRDHYKKLYFDEHGEDYGDKIYNVPSTFKKGDKVYQLPFAQSVPVEIASTEVIIPRIISFDPINEISSPYKGKARVYYFQGLKAMSTSSWDLVNSATLAATNITDLPAFGHLDDRTTPTFDLNFSRPIEVYYTATAYTSNNLFTGYHDQFLRELTGRDSKFLQLYMKLNENDLQGEFLRQLWIIKGTIYRINKIQEYDGNGDSTTWTELIRINKGTNAKVFTLGSLDLPAKAPILINQFEKSIVDKGYDNTIPENNKNIFVQGNNNFLNSGIENVALLNSSNMIIPVGDVTVIGGEFVLGGVSVTKTASNIAASENVRTYVVNTTGGDRTITLPASPLTGKTWDINKPKQANDVFIVVDGGGTINDVLSVKIKQKNTTISVRFDGLNYLII